MTRADTDTTSPWWQRGPLDRVVRLHGSPLRDLAESVDPLPAEAPAVLFLTVAPGTASHLASAVAAALERAALDLVPLWLPGGREAGDTSTLERRAAQARAREFASTTPHFGPYLAALADAFVAGTTPRPDAFARETRLAGCGRVVAAANGRPSTLLVLDVPTAVDPAAVAAAAEWVCGAGVAVWLTGPGAGAVDRFPSIRVDAPTAPADVATVVERFRPLGYPPVEGHPHAASAAEKLLDRHLSRHEWARGRGHNRVLRLTTLSRPFTVDVLWSAEKVAVEIDGPEHRGRARFTDDRSRDNQLQTHGYIVLRFTNEDVLTDHEQVSATIEKAVRQRRSRGNTT